jgi:hypothetical protein
MITARKHDIHGNPVGRGHSNPIFDTRIYPVEFPDGYTQEFSANVIAQNLYSQVDEERNQFLLLDELIDHEKTADAIDENNKFQVSQNGNILMWRTMKGWHLCVKWKDGSTSWKPLKDLKEAYPVQVAEYAISRGLADCIAFKWWIPHTIKHATRIIKSIKSRVHKKTHKYGIRDPRTIKEAYEIDQETNTDYWHQAILKEMKNNAIAFRFLEPDEHIPFGSTWIPCHMIFDIKLDLTRKARFVAGGHWTDTPTQLTYSSIVMRESVRIAFLIAALNDLEILLADVGNAYLQAPAREKVHTTAGPEFQPHWSNCNYCQSIIWTKVQWGSMAC